MIVSNFGFVINVKRVILFFIKCFLGEYDILCVKVVVWGVINEVEVIKIFIVKIYFEVVEIGVWFDELGVFGVFFDGLVGEDYVLEVKCFYIFRNVSIEEVLKSEIFCLE